MTRVVADLNPKTFGEHMRANEFDIEQYWKDHEDKQRARSIAFESGAATYRNGRSGVRCSEERRSPLSDYSTEFFDPAENPFVRRLERAQRGDAPHETMRGGMRRSLLSALLYPRNKREETRAMRIIALLVILALGYPAVLAFPHLAYAFGVFANWLRNLI